jgi:hypothetical protein
MMPVPDLTPAVSCQQEVIAPSIAQAVSLSLPARRIPCRIFSRRTEKGKGFSPSQGCSWGWGVRMVEPPLAAELK